jgi:hypothetical protein
MKNFDIKEIPIVIFIATFSIPMTLAMFANYVIEKYVDWVWTDEESK